MDHPSFIGFLHINNHANSETKLIRVSQLHHIDLRNENSEVSTVHTCTKTISSPIKNFDHKYDNQRTFCRMVPLYRPQISI